MLASWPISAEHTREHRSASRGDPRLCQRQLPRTLLGVLLLLREYIENAHQQDFYPTTWPQNKATGRGGLHVFSRYAVGSVRGTLWRAFFST
jgi:hypothetical protein